MAGTVVKRRHERKAERKKARKYVGVTYFPLLSSLSGFVP